MSVNEKEYQNHLKMIFEARNIIMKQDKPNGEIMCPRCKGILAFAVAKNKHVRGQCNTKGCLQWME